MLKYFIKNMKNENLEYYPQKPLLLLNMQCKHVSPEKMGSSIVDVK